MLKRFTIVTAVITLVCFIAAAVLMPFAVRDQRELAISQAEEAARISPVAALEWSGDATLQVGGYYNYELVKSEDGLLHVESSNLEIGTTKAGLINTSNGWRLDVYQDQSGWNAGLRDLTKWFRQRMNRRTNTVRLALPDSIKEINFTSYSAMNVSTALADVQVNTMASPGFAGSEYETSAAEGGTERTVYDLKGLKGSQKLNLEFPSENVRVLEGVTLVGDINVTISPDDRIYLEVDRDDSWNIASQYLDPDYLRLVTEITGGTLSLTVEGQENKPRWGDPLGDNYRRVVNVTLRIPRSVNSIKLTSRVGDIEIESQTAALILSSDVGDISIRNSELLGGTAITSAVGEADISGTVSGEIQISTDVGDVNMEVAPQAGSKVSIDTEIGSVDLSLGSGSWRVTKNGKEVAQSGDGSGALFEVETSIGEVNAGQ